MNANLLTHTATYDKTRDEEVTLFKQMKKFNDNDVRDYIISSNLKFVAKVTTRYKSLNVSMFDIDDLFSIGVIGLINAVDTFDENRGIRFISYASTCIENEINMYLRRIMPKAVITCSLNDIVKTDTNGFETELGNMIPDDDNKIDTIIENIDLMERVDALPKQNRTVIYLKYGLNGHKPMRQIDISKRLGVAQSYVSRLERKGIKILKNSYNN